MSEVVISEKQRLSKKVTDTATNFVQRVVDAENAAIDYSKSYRILQEKQIYVPISETGLNCYLGDWDRISL